MVQQWNKADVLTVAQGKMKLCFGMEDRCFGDHPSEEKEAKILRDYCVQHKISLAEIENIAKKYLIAEKCIGEHINEEMSKVRQFFGKSLS